MLNYYIIKILSCFILDSKKRKEFKAKHIYMDKSILKIIKSDRLHRSMYKMGIGSYAGADFYVANPAETTIGKYTSIADEVCLGLPQHPLNCLTTHSFIITKTCPRFEGALDVGDNNINFPVEKISAPISIGNDVWIGRRAMVMNGVNIGNGAVVAAGAIVTKDVEPYTIVAGTPAKPIKKRFSDFENGEIIRSKLNNLKWWDYPPEFVKTLPFEDINKCIELLEKHIYLRENAKE